MLSTSFRRMKLDTHSSLGTELASKYIKDFSFEEKGHILKPEMLKLIEETLQDIGIVKDFLSRIPLAQELCQQLTFRTSRLKSFFTAKETIK